MIKKYGIGLLAIIIAVSLAAFTTPKHHLTATHVFEFDGTVMGGYSEANVSNPSNTYWKYIGEISSQPLCSGSDKACRLAVTDDFVDDPLSPQQLSGVTISTSTSSTGDAIVTAITDPNNENAFSNQP